ncbi:hypothetical protein EJB05_03938, partial [Eragrostis curvula]
MDDAAWPSSAFIVLNGSTLVDGISLYVRRLDDLDNLTTDLAIRLTDAALRSAEAELGARNGGAGLEVQALVKIAHRQVLVLAVVFTRRYHGKLIYYLVYDHADASLHMVPYVPRHLEIIYTSAPAPVPARAADGRGYELALMARECLPRLVDGQGHQLCVFSPASPRRPAPARGKRT